MHLFKCLLIGIGVLGMSVIINHENQKQQAAMLVAESEKLTRAEAVDIVIKDAGINISDIKFASTQVQRGNGVCTYFIELYANGKDYRYYVHLRNGDIINKSINDRESLKSQYINEVKVKSIVEDHLGKAIDDIYIRLTGDEFNPVYTVNFKSENYHYIYELNALTGVVNSYIRNESEGDKECKQKQFY